MNIIYIMDYQYYFNLLYLFLSFFMSFTTFSRVDLHNKTIYKAPNKLNNTIKYKAPSNR